MQLALTLMYHQHTTNGVGWYVGGVGYKIHYGVGSYIDVPPMYHHWHWGVGYKIYYGVGSYADVQPTYYQWCWVVHWGSRVQNLLWCWLLC